MGTSDRPPARAGAWAVPLHSRNPGQGSASSSATVSTSNQVFAADRNLSNKDVTNKVSVAEYEDSDSSEDHEDGKTDVEALQAAIFGEYTGGESLDDLNDAGIAKIRGLLVAARSGGTACLICLERVRATDHVWDCKSGCYAIFHITCIQSWARQALNAAELRALNRLSAESFPGAAAASVRWHCPKCRAEYTSSQIPREYRCFCSKEVNPGSDPWLTPHTCGERCGRQLDGDCGHECKLLCHPGPCPPCPQLVRVSCFCGAKSEVRRCGRSKFSCESPCRKTLACRKHVCEGNCHDGDCAPCTKTDKYSCQCKKEVAVRPCVDSVFRCEHPCERELSCKRHVCERGCHAGACGECKLAGRRSCPCGKKEYKGVGCERAVPTCGSTCEKMLSCSKHRCQERCHTGPCNTTCRIVLVKACHCGGLKKEVPCHQEFMCDRKCQRIRDCTRHPCRKRCCDGDCPPCHEVCGKRLRCKNHKCPAPCHREACAPCPVSVRISCACGVTSFEVPCGMEKDQKPPRCSKRCQIPPRCSHGALCKPHACHYGPCPPCQLPCKAELPCGHKCNKRCHGPRPVPNPEYTLKPKKKKKVFEDPNAVMGRPCPPCVEIITKQCLGQHLGIERMMVCSEAKEFQCGNACGNLQSCGNHFCNKPCHFIQTASGSDRSISLQGTKEADSSDTCEQCPLECQKKRTLCPHPCPLPCHPGDCPPCKVLVKRGCYCETMVHVYDCDSFTAASAKLKAKMLSCGGPCHRKLPNCAHMCSDICHLGPCQMANSCRKKVIVRCECQRLKKEWLCSEVQGAQRASQEEKSRTLIGLLPCDQICLKLAAEKKAKEETEQQLRQRRAKEAEAQVATPSLGKRRKNRYQVESQQETTRFQEFMSAARKVATVAVVVVLVCLVGYFGFKGLLELNTWMNRRDIERMKKRPTYGPRF
ncbi:NF-X1-type zinc finger protein NFXL1 [Marchantia polymorpha subsp. ruderalis]